MSFQLKYKRALLKLSGEALAGPDGKGLDHNMVNEIAGAVKSVVDEGGQIAIVIGGGNIIRGASQADMDRENADYMGMLATLINSLGLCEGFKRANVKARVMSAIPMDRVCDPYYIRNAKKHLEDGEVVILGGGTGVPYFTTDTNASLRACELKCDCVLKATKVDGVYSADPVKDPTAVKYDKISYDEVLAKELKVMDSTAISMCMDNNIPLIVFDITQKENIIKSLQGDNVGTIVS